ncbi:UNVERIFIED_ORG: hypothetical protein GGD58_001726 [Rhizobium pisi]
MEIFPTPSRPPTEDWNNIRELRRKFLRGLIDSLEWKSDSSLVHHPCRKSAAAAEAFIIETLQRLTSDGISCPIVSNGGKPSLFEAHFVPSATEHRASADIYNDRQMVRMPLQRGRLRHARARHRRLPPDRRPPSSRPAQRR